MGLDPKSVEGNLKFQQYEPKTWEETDVDIKITHCGICGSDLHTLRSGWGPTLYPVSLYIVSSYHASANAELLPLVCCRPRDRRDSRQGWYQSRTRHQVSHHSFPHPYPSNVILTTLRVGDRVGVGAQSSSCLKPDCEECSAGLENHCTRMVGTYNGKYPDGSKSYGGYADYCRAPSHFVFKIPDGIPSEEAAPMLCGGITVFSPLHKNGAGPGKKVGIVGIGGLGHFGLLYAKVRLSFPAEAARA